MEMCSGGAFREGDFGPRQLRTELSSGTRLIAHRGGTGCGFVDDALRAPDGLPWTTLRVAHRADLRPQAPQPATTMN